MPSKKKDPLILAIEIFALAREWIFKPYQDQMTRENVNSDQVKSQPNKLNGKNKEKPWKASELYFFLDELYSSEDDDGKFSQVPEDDSEREGRAKSKTPTSEKLRKRYEPYLKNFSERYKIPVSFQDKYLDAHFEDNPMTIIGIVKDYLHDFAYSYSPEALELVVRNWNPMGDILYFFILLRYSISRKVAIEFQYQKSMTQLKTSRRVIPYLIANVENKLSLIAKDIKDGETKSFPISRILNVKSDLRTIIHSYPGDGLQEEEEFDFIRYRREDPSSRVHKENIRYEIEISPRNLDILRHGKNLSIRELDKEASQSHWKVIEIETYRERELFDLLFNYGTFAKLVSPVAALEKFKKKLTDLKNFY